MDFNHNQEPRWVNILDRDVIEENNEENEDVNSDSNDSDFNDEIDSDDSGYDTNLTLDDNDVEIADDSERENERTGDSDENANSAYVVLGKVEGLPRAFLVQLTTWCEFKRQFVNEIRCRHLAGEMEVIFERTLWVKSVNYGYWSVNILRLQKQIRDILPNVRVVNDSGIIQYECRMSGIMSQIHSSLISGFYKIVVKVQHRAEICSFLE